MTIVKNLRVYDREKADWVSVDVDITIDVGGLAQQLAPKAHRNKSGKAALADGKVRVTLRRAP
jgi:hypothetical protein